MQVKKMFYHGFDSYMQYAFPLDEIRPMSCTGEDSLGGYSLTLVSFLAGLLNFLGGKCVLQDGDTSRH